MQTFETRKPGGDHQLYHLEQLRCIASEENMRQICGKGREFGERRTRKGRKRAASTDLQARKHWTHSSANHWYGSADGLPPMMLIISVVSLKGALSNLIPPGAMSKMKPKSKGLQHRESSQRGTICRECFTHL